MPGLDHGNGTTPCPNCGRPMGMVTWTGQKPWCHRCQERLRSNPKHSTCKHLGCAKSTAFGSEYCMNHTADVELF